MRGWSFGCGATGRLEDEIEWAREQRMDFVEFGADFGDNALETFNDERVRHPRGLAETCEVQLAIHTASSVNIAEIAPSLNYIPTPRRSRSGSWSACALRR